MEKALSEHTVKRIDVDIQEDLVCKGDFHLLLNMMNSLMDNAVKFSKDKYHTHIEFGSIVKDGAQVFFVRDNGIGFEQERARIIFEPFHAYHTDVNFEGIGLSLATVERIVNRHNGRIWAEGRPGLGTTIYFTIDEKKAE